MPCFEKNSFLVIKNRDVNIKPCYDGGCTVRTKSYSTWLELR